MFEGLFQPMHLLILLVIVLIIFGPSKLADLGKSLGQGIKGFKESVRDDPAHPPAASNTTSSTVNTTAASAIPPAPTSTTAVVPPATTTSSEPR